MKKMCYSCEDLFRLNRYIFWGSLIGGIFFYILGISSGDTTVTILDMIGALIFINLTVGALVFLINYLLNMKNYKKIKKIKDNRNKS